MSASSDLPPPPPPSSPPSNNEDVAALADSLRHWHKVYEEAEARYTLLTKQMQDEEADYQKRVQPTNEYLNAILAFQDSTRTVHAYVTNQGVVKPILSNDILEDLSGNTRTLDAPIPWKAEYTRAGTVLRNDLIAGTPVEPGQQLGYEGNHVLVDRLIDKPAPTATYRGCYRASRAYQPVSRSAMSFVECRNAAFELTKPYFALINPGADGKGTCVTANQVHESAKHTRECDVLAGGSNVRVGRTGTSDNDTIAWYAMNDLPAPQSLQSVGYIDGDSTLHVYDTDALHYTNEYTQLFANVGFAGDSGTLQVLPQSSLASCKARCNDTASCAAIVFDNQTQVCRTQSSIPFRQRRYRQGSSVFLRQAAPKHVPVGVSNAPPVSLDATAYALYRKANARINGDTPQFQRHFSKQAELDDAEVSMKHALAKIHELQSMLRHHVDDVQGAAQSLRANAIAQDVAALQDSVYNLDQRYQAMGESTRLELERRRLHYLGWSSVAILAALVALRILSR